MQPLRSQAIWGSSKPPKPDPAALASRFVEPLRRDNALAPVRPVPPRPALVATAERFTGHPGPSNARPSQAMAAAEPIARGKSGLPINVLISALVVIALVPSAILFVQLWRDMMQPHSVTLPVIAPRTAAPPLPAGLDYPKKDASRFRVEDNDVEEAASPPAVAATDEVPHGPGGWSWAYDQTGALPVPAPVQSSLTSMTAEPDAGDGPVPTQPAIQPGISPAETKMAGAADSNPFEETEQTGQPEVAAAVPLPQRKPTASAGTEPAVRTVKVVTIEAPPVPSRPHDGAYALGSPAEAPAEWMETKTAVDMHAKAEQSSETLKVAEGGTKMRVTARDKNWVQVTDPATSTTGWIYNRFLQPTEPPAD